MSPVDQSTQRPAVADCDRSGRRRVASRQDRPAHAEHVDLRGDVRGEPVLHVRHQRPRGPREPHGVGVEVQQRRERGHEDDLRRRPCSRACRRRSGRGPSPWPSRRARRSRRRRSTPRLAAPRSSRRPVRSYEYRSAAPGDHGDQQDRERGGGERRLQPARARADEVHRLRPDPRAADPRQVDAGQMHTGDVAAQEQVGGAREQVDDGSQRRTSEEQQHAEQPDRGDRARGLGPAEPPHAHREADQGQHADHGEPMVVEDPPRHQPPEDAPRAERVVVERPARELVLRHPLRVGEERDQHPRRRRERADTDERRPPARRQRSLGRRAAPTRRGSTSPGSRSAGGDRS